MLLSLGLAVGLFAVARKLTPLEMTRVLGLSMEYLHLRCRRRTWLLV